ncbi:hypothetical protein QJS65_20430 (plasmid) [Bacillus altitudinis]|uniref:hypothetical protein n=1 Tax=Bacillus altitudinis TaxID=293387 RepID=UPI0024A93A30|nr:hypothetical protein [Bacillus altitudinis]WHF29115.1 hypothetical protein QJS65_20430 [Bacillus altitudinis]
MKAWHVQDKYGEYQQIIFADKRSEAISKSEAKGWNEFIDIRAKRAKYADDLNTEPVKLIQAQLENGWWFECHGNCRNQVTTDDKYSIVHGSIYCGECSDKIN